MADRALHVQNAREAKDREREREREAAAAEGEN
jgi:hypothetical protein